MTETLKKWYFSPMMPMTEKKNYLVPEHEKYLSEAQIKEKIVKTKNGDEYPLIHLTDLKSYLRDNPEIVLYDVLLDIYGDDELIKYIKDSNIKITRYES